MGRKRKKIVTIRYVYVAGAYDAPNIVSALDNVRRGIDLGYTVLKVGFVPYTPFLDFQYALCGPMSRDEYIEYSLAWLERCDALIVVTEGAEQSKGTQAEIARAREMGIPVVYSVEELLKVAYES